MKALLLRPALVGLLLFTMACGDPAEKLGEHLTRADDYLEEQSYAEAIIEYKNVLQIDPNNAAAHWGLARAYTGAQKPREAYWELKESVRLDSTNLEAKLRYGQYLLFGKEDDLEEAVTQAEDVIEAEPSRWEAFVLKGRAEEALGREKFARAAYETAAEVASDEAIPLLRLANYERKLGNAEAAEKWFRKLTEVQPSFPSWGALAGFLASEGRDAEAEGAYRKALAAAEPEEQVTAHSLLANFYYAKGRFGEAEQVLRDGLEESPDNLELTYGLARFYNARGEEAKADAMIQQATRSDPKDPAPHLVLSAYRGRQGDLQGALEAANQALAVDPEHLQARLRKAELLVDLGYRSGDASQTAQGRAIVDAVLAKNASNPEALFVKAKIDVAEDRPEEAVAALRRCVDVRPDWAQAHFLLGSALFLRRDVNGARAATSRALELDANLIEAKRVMARIHAASREEGLAVEVGRQVLAADPSDHGLRILVSQSLVRLGRTEEARAELRAIPEAERDSEAQYALGRIAYLSGNRKEARRNFEAALAKDPERYEILRSLLDLDLREERLGDSRKRIDAAASNQPENPKLAQLSGLVALYAGDSAAAEQRFRRAIELDPNDLAGYENLARYLLVSGRPDDVLKTYEDALESNPESGTLHLIVGSLYELQSRTAEAVERYEAAVKINPNLAVAKNNLAYLLSETGGDLDRALSLAQEAKELLPDNPNAADTLGWVLFKKNVPSAAIGYLREAERGLPVENPQLGTVRHHLALAYEANGQPELARETLERALKQLQDPPGGGAPGAEPPWAAEARSMLERLAPAAPGSPAPASQEG